MSKQIEVRITCPKCGTKFTGKVYRTIWGEYPENRQLVMDDKINVVHCKNCNDKLRIPIPLMYTNAKQTFAVWWEPKYDPQIDKDVESYIAATGATSYFSTAPRIKSWEEFKNTIIKFEKGILKGNPAKRPDFKAMMEQMLKNK